jgi:iron(III) transport system substrate-binding protein
MPAVKVVEVKTAQDLRQTEVAAEQIMKVVSSVAGK